MTNLIYKNYSSSINFPSLIQVDQNIVVASFPLMKLVPAKYVIEKAIRENRVKKDDTVVETSSGTYAMGLAIVCAEHEIPFHIVSDPVIDQDLKYQLEHLGGKVEIVEDHKNGHQIARLKAVHKYLMEHPSAFWPQQYDNPEHLQAYIPFADYLVQHVGVDFILVASVGSGSSSCGTITRLRTHNPSIALVGVDTFGSILFGLENKPRLLRGLGNSLIPKNLNHTLFDDVHWVSHSQGFISTLEFYTKTALYVGPTTGACYQVAKFIAKQNPKKKIVFISADMGYRYTSSVYNKDWMQKMNLHNMARTENPIKVDSVSQINASSLEWAYMNWKRSSLKEVISG